MVDKLEKVRAEVERRINELQPCNTSENLRAHGAIAAYYQILSFINSLQEEPVSESLADAAGKYGANATHPQYYTKNGAPVGIGEELSDAVIYGANWQKQQDQETIELAEDHAMLAGMVKGKEEMIEKACNYLHEHREEVKTEDNGIAGWISDEFIENFRKNMEE